MRHGSDPHDPCRQPGSSRRSGRGDEGRRAGDADAVSDEEFETLLARSVGDVVRQQAEVGIDLVSDGEFGKTISWSRYILERLNGFEDRSDPNSTATDPKRPLGPRTDVERFPEFYAEYNETQGFEDVMRNPVCVGPISYAGHDALQRDIANVKAAVDAARSAGYEVAAFLPGGRAGERGLQAPGRVLRVRGGVRLRRRRRAARGVPGDHRRRPDAAGRRRPPADDVRQHRQPRHARRLPALGAAADRRPQPRARGHPPRRAAATTSAGAASTHRTSATCRSARSPTSCCR